MVNIRKIWKPVLQLSAVAVIVVLAFWLGRLATESSTVRSLVIEYGYTGIFLVAVISGINIIVPIPAVVFMPLFLEVGLNFWITVFIIAFGMSIGDTVAYFLGRAGRAVAESAKTNYILTRLERIHKRYPRAPVAILLLYAAFIPFPNEVLVIPLGFIGYRFRDLVLALLVGNIVFNSIIAIGIISLFDFLKGIL